MLTPSFTARMAYRFFGTVGRALEVELEGRLLVRDDKAGGGSKVQGKPADSIQRPRATSSIPVNINSDLRTIVSSRGEVKESSVIVFVRCGPMARSHIWLSRLVEGVRRWLAMSQSCCNCRSWVSRPWVISQS